MIFSRIGGLGLSSNRERLIRELRGLGIFRRVYDSEANFILVITEFCQKLYRYLIACRVVVRLQDIPPLIGGGIRITVGTREENDRLLEVLHEDDNVNGSEYLMKKMLFIDRDGTIIKEPTDNFQVDRPEKLEFMPGVIGALREITGNTDFRLVMVSNQDGLGTADFPMEDFMLPQTLMLKVLESEGIVFDEICIDPSRPEEYSRFRKPGIGMVEKYLNEYLDTENSYVIGDRETDMQLAAHMGIKGIWLGEWRETDLPVVLQYRFLAGNYPIYNIRKPESPDL